jgi:hypothetical protein
MNMNRSGLICTLFLFCLVFLAACTTPGQPPAAVTPAVPAPVTGTPVPVLSPAVQVTIPLPATTTVNTSSAPAGAAVNTTVTWIEQAYGRDAADEPQIVLQNFARKALVFDIPDCGMREAFPQAAGDPLYGIRQPIPKLTAVTEDDIHAFYKAYAKDYHEDSDLQYFIDPNAIGGARCNGVPADPKWNFVRFNATLVPRNARPADYDIGINFRYHGNVVGQVRVNATFIIDKPVFLIRYIPLKNNELDAFDSIGLVFARKK